MSEETKEYGIIKDLEWNVVDEETFRDRVRKVFEQVARALSCTLGPYGNPTIIDQMGQMHITKDGWQVLKKLYFHDRMNQNILNLLSNISAQVVLKVGDGSTSSIIAANSLLKHLEGNKEITSLRSKDLIDNLNKCVEKINTKILNSSIKINREEGADFEEIYKMAKISTNGDEEIARIIQDIYKQTLNPTIGFTESRTNKTYYEVIDGYRANVMYLDRIYCNTEENTCVINKPLIVMFDHKIGQEHYEKIIQPLLQLVLQAKTRLVVVAPYYENTLLEIIRRQTNAEFKAMNSSVCVFTRVSLVNKLLEDQYNDFSVMSGSTLIKEIDLESLFKGEGDITDYIGQVDQITIGHDSTLIKGLCNRNENMYNVILNDAINKYNQVKETHIELNIVNTELYDLSQRLSKLRGKVGFIYVGGNTSMEKLSNKDLVEDAVKACESAFNFGYNIGGNLIIPMSIEEMLKTEKLTKLETIILETISNAFKDVFKTVLYKKYKSDVFNSDWTTDSIIDTCIETKQCFDLIKEEFSTEIINSCFTDVEILKACTSIITLIMSSNQYLTILIPNN